jgi:glycosyltransferase involved in cell wall biosynthesis
MKKIGLGLTTYKRPDYFLKVINNIPLKDSGIEVVVVNDGTPYEDIHHGFNHIQHPVNKGVGIAKNSALKFLLEQKCDYFFLMEDDIIIKDPAVFEEYIKMHVDTGIHHFNYSQHGLMNKYPGSDTPSPKTVIQYKNSKVALYPHCVGAFSFYTRKCLEKVGLMDEKFYNATEHLEHTYRIIQNKMHPSFWWFADLPNANDFLTDIPWTQESSTISSHYNHHNTVVKSLQYFYEKHKVDLLQIPQGNLEEIKLNLKEIYKLWKI